MSEDGFDDPDFDDPAHAPIRDLLASARVDSPIPAEVAARLDATLAELSGRAPADVPLPAAEPAAVVVPLRRRLAPRLLVAAALVLVAGAGAVGVDRMLTGSGSSDSLTAGSAADTGSKADSAAPENAPAASPVSPQEAQKSLQYAKGSTAFGGVFVLSTTDFASEVQDLDLSARNAGQLDGLLNGPLRSPSADFAQRPSSTDEAPAASGLRNDIPDNLPRTSRQALACRGPRIAGTTSYPVLLDGRPAVLVVHPRNAGTRLVEAWSCDGSQVLAFTTVTS